MAQSIDNKARPALSGWPMILGWLAMLIFALHASTHMVGAGDTWVAMACGRHFINHGVNTVEPFSANSHKAGPTEEEVKKWPGWAQWITDKVGMKTVKYWHPTGWINQNWLTHVIFYWLTTLSPFADAETLSFDTLVYWKFAIYIITVICVYYTGRLLGINPALSVVFACFAMFTGRTFFDIRPAGFSNLLTAVFLLILALTTYRNILYIWLIVPLTVFWCNVHGGYIYVFIMLVPFVILHLLTILSQRSTVSLHSILMMLALYVLMLKFTSHDPLMPVNPAHDSFLITIILIIIASFVLTRVKVGVPVFYGYHIFALIIVFLILFARLFSLSTSNYNNVAADYIRTSKLSFFLAFVAAIALGIVVTFFKGRLLTIQRTSICHIVAAGFVAFVAAIVFNPFHLTNLTHTFLISVSKHAKMWRSVNEWHPGFEWVNPVGSGFPFLILFILSIGLIVFWLFSFFFKPKLLKAPKNELEAQEKFFKALLAIFGYAAAVLICWVTFISFSFVKADGTSFVLCAMLVGILLLSIYKNVHLIYLAIGLTLLAMLSSKGQEGYAGRYIFPFCLLPTYVILHIFVSLFSKTIKFKPLNIVFVALAAVISLLLMTLIFNPFELEMPFSNVKTQLWELRRPWKPIYERNLDISYKYLFRVLYIINIGSIIFWLILPYLQKLFSSLPDKIREDSQPSQYELPRIDLALMAIAALSIYMAYRSRRFIPIAAITACPIIAMLINQMAQTISAACNFYKRGSFSIRPMSYRLRLFFTFAAAVAVIAFGICWGIRFKHVYLDFWPADTKLKSVFMRMTASNVKPFYACQFIRDNKLKGKMFNYWTEGGFIAWGQVPDPNTGRTPLQLFMDGRAQAAYDPKVYYTWANIMAGGPLVQGANVRKTTPNYAEVSNWVNEQLKNYDVWVVLMPLTDPEVFNGPFVKSLEYHSNWAVLFVNNKQKLFVDITTPRGMELLKGIFNGETLYPDEFTKDLAIAYNMLFLGKDKTSKTQGYDFAVKAFKLKPSQASIQMVLTYARYPELRPAINDICKNYFDEFTENKKLYEKQDGYFNKIWAALLACDHLRKEAEKQGNIELTQFYKTKIVGYNSEQRPLREEKRW